jgi:hypothetical protein
MSDKELLELAAKAAGYPISEGYFEAAESPNAWWGWVYVDGDGEPPNDSAWTELWNPLTDDGDALRLAVKLRILDMHKELNAIIQEEQRYHDRPSATRRAIVRAAAEIGKAMQ